MGFLSALAPFAAPLASIFGSGLGAYGQAEANRTNIMLARENREWQERMSNTANQRAAADLEAAGLNRILALGKPASTPAGNVAQVGNVGAAATQGLANVASSAVQLRQAEANLEAIRKRAKLTDNQARAIGALAEMGENGAELIKWIKERLMNVDYASVGRELVGQLSMWGIDAQDKLVQGLMDMAFPNRNDIPEVKVKRKKRKWYPIPAEYRRRDVPSRFEDWPQPKWD